jgi:ATPase subunit of ABC transporter with duplicated ATPase domains
VVDFDHVSKGFGDKLLIKDLDFKLPPGGVVGVIGPNGAGKTTLFKMITGEEQPDEGSVTLGETVKLGYVNQSRDALDPNKTVWEEISDGNDMIMLGDKEVPSRAYVGAFNFKGGDQQKKVGVLSGGERNRVHLAKMLKEGGNLLLLDEPTNDLDVETLSALESALEDFPAAPWSSPTTAFSSTASPPTSLPMKATAMWNGLKAASPTIWKTKNAALAMTPWCPSG